MERLVILRISRLARARPVRMLPEAGCLRDRNSIPGYACQK